MRLVGHCSMMLDPLRGVHRATVVCSSSVDGHYASAHLVSSRRTVILEALATASHPGCETDICRCRSRIRPVPCPQAGGMSPEFMDTVVNSCAGGRKVRTARRTSSYCVQRPMGKRADGSEEERSGRGLDAHNNRARASPATASGASPTLSSASLVCLDVMLTNYKCAFAVRRRHLSSSYGDGR